MMRWIVGSSLKFRYLVVGLAVAMMVFGGGLLRAMPVDVFPEFAPPKVEVHTAAIGLSAADVEALITVPMEQALNGVPGLDVMRSKSVPQYSTIVMIFEPGTDLMTARQQVAERMQTAIPTLPTWAAPPVMLQPLSSTSRLMKIGLTSDELSMMDMSMIAYWKIRANLLRIPGVANVAIWGERLQMMQVQADPQRLKANDVSLDEVMEVTADALDAGLLQYSDGAVIGTGGFIETPNQRLGIRHTLPIVSPDDLAQVVVEERDGKPLRLGDVANVVEDHQPLLGDAVINDGPGLMLIVEKLPWGNTLEVTRQVEAALEEMKPGLPGLQIDSTIFRPATFIEMAIENLTMALFLGVLLVVLVLIAFLFEWRTALISVIAIPLSLVAAGMVLYLRGATINTMVLAGFVISVGVVVDDAIIDIENIVRRLRQAREEGSDKSTASIILDGSLEVRSAIVYATLDRCRGAAAGLLPGRVVRRLLPAAGHLLCAGGAGLDGGGADRHTRSGADPAAQGAAREACLAAGAVAATRLWRRAGAHRAEAGLCVPDRRRRRGNGCRVLHATRKHAAPGIQGARFPDALVDRSLRLAHGRGADHHAGQ